MTRRPPTPTLFPYTTLFRSHDTADHGVGHAHAVIEVVVEQDAAAGQGKGQRGLVEPAEPPQQVPGPVELDDLARSEEHTSELQSRRDLVCRLLLEKKKRTMM